MANHQENELRISRYLEDKMTPEEAERFMEDLGEDALLRRQYEDELLMYSLLEDPDAEEGGLTGENTGFFQSADEHIRMVEAALGDDRRPAQKNEDGGRPAQKKQGGGQPAQTPVIRFSSRWGLVAAAAVVAVIGTTIVLFNRTRNAGDRHTAVTTPPADTGAAGRQPAKGITPMDSGLVSHPVIRKTDGPGPSPTIPAIHPIDDQSIYDKYYIAFSSASVPVEVADSYNDYRAQDYNAVTSLKGSTLAGTGNKQALIQQYVRLLKGLSYLGGKDASDALREFDAVLQSAGEGSECYYTAQWYSALAWLKADNPGKAAALAKDITGTDSPYKTKAAALAADLSH